MRATEQNTPAPRLSDRLESMFAALGVSPDLIDAMRRMPESNRAEVEAYMIPALDDLTRIVYAHIAGERVCVSEPVDFGAIRERYPKNIAECVIVGHQKAVEGGKLTTARE